MKIIEAGDFTYVSYNEENSAKHNGVHLYVPGHLDGEKYEDDGRLTGTCPVPMDDYGFAELSYTQDGISTCKRLRLAIVEGTVDELRGLALGDCHLRSNAKLQQSYINDSLKNQAARIGGDTLSTVAQVEIDRRLRIANALLKDIDRINCGGHPDPIMESLVHEARKLGVIL